MKKGLVLGLAGLFLLTGCGNKVKCSSGDSTYEGTFKKDNLTKITMTEKYSNKKEAKENCALVKSMKSLYGKDAKVKCSSKKVSLTMNMPEGTKMTKKEFKTNYCK